MRTFPFLFLSALVLIFLHGCDKDSRFSETDLQPRTFTLHIDVPSIIQTKSSISGREGIFGIQMLCFDENNLYLGLGAVLLHPDGETTSYAGTISGSVPAGTAAIHLIANAGLIPQQEWRNQPDNVLVGTLTSSSSNTHIVYWGYHRAADSEQMNEWLNASPCNSVQLLRDRAKITLDAPDPDWNHSSSALVTEHIVSARFAVCNGLEEGMLAPYDKVNLDFSYDAPPTLPASQTRYTGAEEELTPPGEAQFLFEDENTLDNPVKVILETIYEITDSNQTRTEKKFHQIVLLKDDYSLFRIRRNHQYNIIIGNLPSSIAYDSFADALAGSPSNNQTVFVHEIVPQVISGAHSLDFPGGTTRIFQKTQEGPQTAVIRFSLLNDGLPDSSVDASNFSAVWLSNKYIAYPDAELAIEPDSESGYFRLLVQLYHPITDDLKSGKILLIDKTYGLARYLSIYSITAFSFNASITATGVADNPYRLRFTIPESFPAPLFPFAVAIITEDFRPTSAQNADQALGIIVSDTSFLTGGNWNYWHTYDVSVAGTYDILLAPAANRSGQLRLWLYADYFGETDSSGNKIADAVLLSVTHGY